MGVSLAGQRCSLARNLARETVYAGVAWQRLVAKVLYLEYRSLSLPLFF